MPRRKPRNKGGRPSKWTPEVIVPLAISLRAGVSPRYAARNAGIGKSTLYTWVRRAKSGDPKYAALLPVMEEAEERWRRVFGN